MNMDLNDYIQLHITIKSGTVFTAAVLYGVCNGCCCCVPGVPIVWFVMLSAYICILLSLKAVHLELVRFRQIDFG